MEEYSQSIWSFDRYIIAKLMLAVGVFLYIYDVPFTFLPYNTGVFVAMAGWAWLILDLLRGRKFSINIPSIVFGTILLMASAYAFFYSYIMGTHDTHVGRALLLMILLFFPGGAVLAWAADRLGYSVDDLMYLIVKVTVVQAVIIYIMFVMPDVKKAVFNVMRDGESRDLLNLESMGVRALGVSLGTTWDLSFCQSLALLFIVLLLPKKNVLLLSIFFLLILGSMFISGRTGLLGAVFAIMLLFCQLLTGSRKIIKNTGKFFRHLVVVILVVVTVVYNSLSDDTKTIVTDSLIPWAFELFISKAEGGSFETSSSNELGSMYFKVSPSTFWFGDGYFEDPRDNTKYYMGTDAGYMRHMLFYGVLGSMFLYTFYLFMFVYMTYHYYRQYGMLYGLMILIMGIYFFIGHIKGDILMGGNMPLRVAFLLYFFILKVKTDKYKLANV